MDWNTSAEVTEKPADFMITPKVEVDDLPEWKPSPFSPLPAMNTSAEVTEKPADFLITPKVEVEDLPEWKPPPCNRAMCPISERVRMTATEVSESQIDDMDLKMEVEDLPEWEELSAIPHSSTMCNTSEHVTNTATEVVENSGYIMDPLKMEDEILPELVPLSPVMCQISKRIRMTASEVTESHVDPLKEEVKYLPEWEELTTVPHSPVMPINCDSPVDSLLFVKPVEISGNALPSASTSSTSLIKRSCPPRITRDAKVITKTNYGSERESSASDGEVSARRFISRVYQAEYLDDTGEVNSIFPEDPILEYLKNVDTCKPTQMYDFQWEPFPDPPIPPQSRREVYSDNHGPTTPNVDPYENFTAIWDRKIMQYIASETNRYAQDLAIVMAQNASLHPDHIGDWHDTSADELYIYFALLLAMGMVVKNNFSEYWSTDSDIFYTPGFSSHMSLRRFQLLNRCLHFNSNEGMGVLDAPEAKLFKLKPVLTHLNEKFQSLYKIGQNIVLDESLVQWTDRSSINQFSSSRVLMPNKADLVGIKSYEICESPTGYLWRFDVNLNTHKSGRPPKSESESQRDPMNESTPSIVLRLIQGLENKGHTLCMDAFYNSPALARKLKSIGFDCVGTLRTDRQFVPESLATLEKSDMRPGQITGFTSGDVDLMVWRGQKRIALISTYHGNDTTTANGTNKPILIHDYNTMVGALDRKDLSLAKYPIEQKHTRVWYKKLFLKLLNVSVLNAFILTKQSTALISHHTFRQTLIKLILDKHSQNIKYVTPVKPVYDVENHYLDEHPVIPRTRNRLRKCVVCNKLSYNYCVGCNKSVCVSPCFGSLHKTNASRVRYINEDHDYFKSRI